MPIVLTEYMAANLYKLIYNVVKDSHFSVMLLVMASLKALALNNEKIILKNYGIPSWACLDSILK